MPRLDVWTPEAQLSETFLGRECRLQPFASRNNPACLDWITYSSFPIRNLQGAWLTSTGSQHFHYTQSHQYAIVSIFVPRIVERTISFMLGIIIYYCSFMLFFNTSKYFYNYPEKVPTGVRLATSFSLLL